MKDPLEIKGYWWLPNQEKNKKFGTLTYTQEDGAYLEIVGAIGPNWNTEINHPLIILGISQSGNPITLYKCLYVSKINSKPDFGSERLYVHFIFDGIHFASENDIKFTELICRYSDLNAWVDIYGFNLKRNSLKNKNIYEIKYELPEAKFWNIGEDFEIGIGFSCNGPNWERVQTNVNITQEAHIIVRSKKSDIEFEKLFSFVDTFRNLMEIATQRISYPLEIYGHTNAQKNSIGGDAQYSPDIQIYFEPIEPITEHILINPFEMIFTYKDLAANNLKTWFDSFEKYRTTFYLYHSTFYKDRLFIENKFLNIAQALEALHSLRFENKYLPESQFLERKSRVLKNIPDDLRGWVEDALSSANYKRFYLKISELFSEKDYLFSNLINDIDLFSKKVRDTRNEFVHHTKQKNTFSKQELIYAIAIMNILFEAYILEIIGFPPEKIQKLLEPKTETYRTGWRHLRNNFD